MDSTSEQLDKKNKEIEDHKKWSESLERDNAGKQERLAVLGGFQAEALNGRETIAALQDKGRRARG